VEGTHLKLIKASNQSPEDPTWPLMWRNVYNLSTRDEAITDLKIHVFDDIGAIPVDHHEGIPIVRLLGIPGIPTEENEIPGVNTILGHLVFPDQEPFASPSLAAEARIQDLYRTSDRADLEVISRYRIETRYLRASTP